MLSLPRDAATVPLVRELCRTAMLRLGVNPDCSADVQLALTEACANVVRHATDHDEYEVHCTVSLSECELRVIDRGEGFESGDLGHGHAAGDAETGRGIHLIRALMDTVDFRSEPEDGTVVHLVKRLVIDPDHRPPFAASQTGA